MLKSFKKQYPFRLAIPSFIFPAGYTANVQRVGPFVDEIELLLFESARRSLPSPREVQELARLAQEIDITYNVHLPIDVDLAARESTMRQDAVRRISRAIACTRCLQPTTFTLHLPFTEAEQRPDEICAWQQRAMKSLAELLASAAIKPQQISLENLDYPPQWLLSIAESLDLSLCLDVGHLLSHGFALQTALASVLPRLDIIHLHAARGHQDHLALDQLPPSALSILVPCLKVFNGSVCIEVFSYERLQISLLHLDRQMGGGTTPPESNGCAKTLPGSGG